MQDSHAQPWPPRYTRGGLVNDEREDYLRPHTRIPLRRVPPILSLPPRHPGAVAVGGRGRRVWLEAKLGWGFEDAVDEEILVLVVAVLAHDGAELGQVASIERTRMRSLRPSKRLTHTAVCVTSERLSFLFRRGTLYQRVKGMHVRTLRDGYSRAIPH